MSSRSDDSPTRRTPTIRTSESETGRHPGLTSGRVKFDDRGNAKWEMRTSGQAFAADASTTLVRKLVPPLSLEPTVRVPKLPTAGAPAGDAAAAKPGIRSGKPERAAARAEMGTVRTFPVPRKVAPAKTNTAAGAKPGSRPAGLMARLFGKKP